MTTAFAGKTALITGAGRGIGRAVPLGLADAGASVILLARSDSQLAQTRAMLLARGAAAGQVRVLPADLGDEEQRTRAAVAALASGRVDVLINNAATVEPRSAATPTPPPRQRWRPTPSTSPPSCAAAESPSTPTGPAGWTPPCRPGSDSRTPSGREPPRR